MASPGFEVTEEMIREFGRSWAEVDQSDTYTGTEGERRRAGLQAVLDMVNQPAEDGSCPMCGCPAPHQELWTVKEVADHFRVSNMTVYRMCADGTLDAIRLGRSFRVPVSEVHRLARGTKALTPTATHGTSGGVPVTDETIAKAAAEAAAGFDPDALKPTGTSRKWWNE